jgi:hypothetical protein
VTRLAGVSNFSDIGADSSSSEMCGIDCVTLGAGESTRQLGGSGACGMAFSDATGGGVSADSGTVSIFWSNASNSSSCCRVRSFGLGAVAILIPFVAQCKRSASRYLRKKV